MRSKKINRSKVCPLYNKCKIRLHPQAATDNPNSVAHLGWRAAYTFFAWIILGVNVNESFLIASFFFALPVLMDCLKFSPLNNLRKCIRRVEIAVMIITLIPSALGVLDILVLKKFNDYWIITTSSDFILKNSYNFSADTFWYILGLVLAVTIVDWFCNDSQIDLVIAERRD